jgi:SCP-2 sterol transfer family
MPETTMEIQEYLESYVPELVGGYLAEKPVADMEGTVFTVEVRVEGEKSLVFGITIEDACRIKMHPGGLENPMVTVTIPEDLIRHVTRQVTSFTGRKQYDGASKAKGSLGVEMAMPGDWVLPLNLTFNGASEPKAVIKGPADVLTRVMTGELNGPQTFVEGKIKMDGDMMFLMSLSSMLF